MFRVGVTIFKSISKWGIYFSVMSKKGEGSTIFTFCVFIPKMTLNVNQELLNKLFITTLKQQQKHLKFPRETLFPRDSNRHEEFA